MEVKVICHNLSGTGGTETVLVKVLNHLSKFHNIQLVLPNKPDNTGWLHNLDSNIQVRMLNKNGKLSKIMFFLKTFLKTTDDTVLLMLGANMIKFAAKVREVFHKKYGIISWIHFSLFDQQMFDPKNIRYADQHWAISTKISKQLQSLGIPDSKIRLIYNPITPAKILSADSGQKDVCHLVYIGRIQFEGQKNLKELFDALGKVHKPVFIDLYGAGADVQRCQEYCKIIGIEKNVRWHGWVNDPWQEIESSPDAIVLSSRYEGLPMVMLEAASRGIPMIVSQFEGYTDILQENINGYSYAIGNSDQLAEKIDKLSGSNINAEQVVDSIKKFYENEYFARLDKILS